MSMEAVGRVPVIDWLMGLTVLACGVATIVSVWRYTARFAGGGASADTGPDDGRGHGERDAPLALPPGPQQGVTARDPIDEELWGIIDSELFRERRSSTTPRSVRIAAQAAGHIGLNASEAKRHFRC